MDEENKANLDASTEEGSEETTEDVTNADETEADDIAAELAKARELAENYKVRAEKAEAKLKPKKETKQDTPTFDPDEIRKQAQQTVREELEQQYLDDLEYPDDLKEEIKKIAKLNNVSIRQAEKDPYVAYKVQQAVQEKRLDEAAVRGTKKSETSSIGKALNPKDFDLNTEEGRKAWQEAKAKRG